MIKALYERVDNKVIFGPYESDHFEVVNGVKQGCVLSPCLFNLVITDLDYMLMDSGGISFGANEIHGLYYADDIILFGVNEGSLQRKLDIASAFASKWNLKYNHTKSQVVVIGEKDKQRSWNLGGNSITETKSYCYLGTMITSSLKDSLHINQHLYRKAMKLLSYMQYTLAKHRDINRIDFADSIYNKAILPSLAHAAGTWFAETKCSQDKLTAIQYKFAKAATKLKCTPSSDALIAELGWIPINDHLDMKRLSYHERLVKMDNSRLPKIVYDLLNCDDNFKGFNYRYNIQNILDKNGADHMYYDHPAHIHDVQKLITSRYQSEFVHNIQQRTSLLNFCLVKANTFKSEYLYSTNCSFRGLQLKLKLRLGVADIGEVLKRQNRGDGICKCGKFESLQHIVFYCQNYTTIRNVFYQCLKHNLPNYVFNSFINNPLLYMLHLLGDQDDVFNRAFTDFISILWKKRTEC